MTLSFKDKYVPCILSRLADDEPQSRIDRTERFVPLEKIRQEIIDNISQLLNSRSRPEARDLNNDEELVHSVLGYGVSDFCGISNSLTEIEKIRREILLQLQFFEPRLKSESIRITILNPELPRSTSTFSLQISAQYAIESISEDFLCISSLDLETGSAIVKLDKDN
ncbi:MAG: type VI secretion system baseplate subunit TssE [Succinivibrio sp.]